MNTETWSFAAFIPNMARLRPQWMLSLPFALMANIAVAQIPGQPYMPSPDDTGALYLRTADRLAAAISKDGRFFVQLSRAGIVSVYDLVLKRLVNTKSFKEYGLGLVQFSADGRLALRLEAGTLVVNVPSLERVSESPEKLVWLPYPSTANEKKWLPFKASVNSDRSNNGESGVLDLPLSDPVIFEVGPNAAVLVEDRGVVGLHGPLLLERSANSDTVSASQMAFAKQIIKGIRWTGTADLEVLGGDFGATVNVGKQGDVSYKKARDTSNENYWAKPRNHDELTGNAKEDCLDTDGGSAYSENHLTDGSYTYLRPAKAVRIQLESDGLPTGTPAYTGAWWSDGKNRLLAISMGRTASGNSQVIKGCLGNFSLVINGPRDAVVSKLLFRHEFVFAAAGKQLLVYKTDKREELEGSKGVRTGQYGFDAPIEYIGPGRQPNEVIVTYGGKASFLRYDGKWPWALEKSQNIPLPLPRIGNSAWVATAGNKWLFAVFDPAGAVSIYRYSIQNGFDLSATVYFSGNGWIANTADGYFYQSPNENFAARMMLSTAGGTISLEGFYDVYHRPDIVRSKLRGDDEYARRASRELTLEKALKSPPPSIGALPAPKGELITERIRIPYTVKSEGGGVGEVLVLHNGKLIKSDGYYKDAPGSTMVALNTTKATSADEVAKGMRKMLGDMESRPGSIANGDRDRVVVRQAKPKTLNAVGEYSDSVEIDVIPGEDNEITVMARNQDNTILGQGQTVRFKSSLPKAEPHLWILPVGIASFQDSGVRKLASPKKDALDFACSYGGKDALMSSGINCDKPGYASSLFKSANIHVVTPLTDEKATRSNILAKLDEIAAKAKPTDTFIWFVSSHGTMDANSVYGLVPFDAKCQDPKCDAASGLVSSNDILEKSKSIKAMKQLLILDTCQAGGLDNKMSGLYDARMSGLAKNMGLHLYAAATATESALDGQDASKNSIFTATLLEGLAGASAKNTEGQISIIPLGQYVKTKTPETSRKAYADMTPQTPVIQHFGKDAPLAGVASDR